MKQSTNNSEDDRTNIDLSVDMFPYTPDINVIATGHVETVILMSKVKE